MVPDIRKNLPTASLRRDETVNYGRSSDNDFHSEIRESWRRCLEKGVDRYDGISHLILGRGAFKNLLEERRDLLNTAKEFMDDLYEYVKGTGFILVLSDEQGYLMDVFGDFETMEQATRVNLLPGYRWGEKESGTNGIGTALILKKPVQVSGGEHYCRKLHNWTCAAAPIFDDKANLIGSLQMSGPADKAHPHTLGLVVAAVKAIGGKITLIGNGRDLPSLDDRRRQILQTVETASEAAVILDNRGGVRQVNSGLKDLIDSDLTDAAIKEILDNHPEIGRALAKGRVCKGIPMSIDTMKGVVSAEAAVIPLRDHCGRQTDTVVVFTPHEHRRYQHLSRATGNRKTEFGFCDIVGRHHDVKAAIHIAGKASSSKSHVLIEGESGTGKELFAQAIHNHSERNGPFLALNCAALPRDLLISELFGYTEGAFTGALKRGKPGKFELASGGTLFLDEIGDMPLDQQATLLRVLQENKVTRLGGSKPIAVDARIICATNKNLRIEIRKGNFRQDLYYRLNVISISLPPLRDRGNDLHLLFNFFLKKTSQKLRVAVGGVHPAVKNCLEHHDWPGNLRELENTAEKLINAADGDQIQVEHLPREIRMCDLELSPHAQRNKQNVPLGAKKIKLLMAEKERQVILDLLARYRGNISRTAKEMGVSRNTVYRKMETYKIAKDYSFA